MLSWQDIVEIGLRLPEVEVGDFIPARRAAGARQGLPRADRSDAHAGVLRRELKVILRKYAGKAQCCKYSRLARNLLKIWPALWTFADHHGVEPTNNHAERALCCAAIYCNLSLGSQSEDSEQRIQRLLSAHTTCRLQRRSLHAYLIGLLGAHVRRECVPLLS